MNRKSFFKTLLYSLVLIPFGIAKRKETEWTKLEKAAAPEKFLPFEKQITTEYGDQYTMRVVLTDQVLIPMPDGTMELNVYRQYVKMLATCFTGGKDAGPRVAVHRRYESTLYDDKDVTAFKYASFIDRVKADFEKGLRTNQYKTIEAEGGHLKLKKIQIA